MHQDVPADVIMLPHWLIAWYKLCCDINITNHTIWHHGCMSQHCIVLARNGIDGHACWGTMQWVSSHTSLLTSKYKHRYSQSVTRLEVQINNTNPNTVLRRFFLPTQKNMWFGCNIQAREWEGPIIGQNASKCFMPRPPVISLSVHPSYSLLYQTATHTHTHTNRLPHSL